MWSRTHEPCWLVMSAIGRRFLRHRAGGRAFNQEFLQEEMLEYFPLNHLLDLLRSMAAAQIQAPANDLEARR